MSRTLKSLCLLGLFSVSSYVLGSEKPADNSNSKSQTSCQNVPGGVIINVVTQTPDSPISTSNTLTVFIPTGDNAADASTQPLSNPTPTNTSNVSNVGNSESTNPHDSRSGGGSSNVPNDIRRADTTEGTYASHKASGMHTLGERKPNHHETTWEEVEAYNAAWDRHVAECKASREAKEHKDAQKEQNKKMWQEAGKRTKAEHQARLDERERQRKEDPVKFERDRKNKERADEEQVRRNTDAYNRARRNGGPLIYFPTPTSHTRPKTSTKPETESTSDTSSIANEPQSNQSKSDDYPTPESDLTQNTPTTPWDSQPFTSRDPQPSTSRDPQPFTSRDPRPSRPTETREESDNNDSDRSVNTDPFEKTPIGKAFYWLMPSLRPITPPAPLVVEPKRIPGNRAQEVANNAANALTQLVKQKGEIIHDDWQTAFTKHGVKPSPTKDNLTNGRNKVEEAANNAVNALTQLVKQKSEIIHDDWQTAFTKHGVKPSPTKDNPPNRRNNAEEAVNNAVNGLIQATGQVRDKVHSDWEDFLTKPNIDPDSAPTEQENKPRNNAQEAANKTAHALAEIADQANDSIQNKLENIKSDIYAASEQPFRETSVGSILLDKAKEQATKIKDRASQAYTEYKVSKQKALTDKQQALVGAQEKAVANSIQTNNSPRLNEPNVNDYRNRKPLLNQKFNQFGPTSKPKQPSSLIPAALPAARITRIAGKIENKATHSSDLSRGELQNLIDSSIKAEHFNYPCSNIPQYEQKEKIIDFTNRIAQEKERMSNASLDCVITTTIKLAEQGARANQSGDTEKGAFFTDLGNNLLDVACDIDKLTKKNIKNKVQTVGHLLKAAVKLAVVLGACSEDAPLGSFSDNREMIIQFGEDTNKAGKEILENVGQCALEATKKILAFAYALEQNDHTSPWEPLIQVNEKPKIEGLETEVEKLVKDIENLATLETAVNIVVDAGLLKLVSVIKAVPKALPKAFSLEGTIVSEGAGASSSAASSLMPCTFEVNPNVLNANGVGSVKLKWKNKAGKTGSNLLEHANSANAAMEMQALRSEKNAWDKAKNALKSDGSASSSSASTKIGNTATNQVPEFFKGNKVPRDHETILSSSNFKKTNIVEPWGARVYECEGKYYYRDTFHTGKGSHLEVFNRQGKHLGEANPLTGELIPNTADKTKKMRL